MDSSFVLISNLTITTTSTKHVTQITKLIQRLEGTIPCLRFIERAPIYERKILITNTSATDIIGGKFIVVYQYVFGVDWEKGMCVMGHECSVSWYTQQIPSMGSILFYPLRCTLIFFFYKKPVYKKQGLKLANFTSKWGLFCISM